MTRRFSSIRTSKFSKSSAEDAKTVIGRTLQVGVLTSAGVMLFGLVLFLVTGNSGYPRQTFPTRPPDILNGLLLLKPYAFILLGLILLIFTPVIRVGVSILLFIKEKDRLYAVITGIVFVILIFSFFLGKAG